MIALVQALQTFSGLLWLGPLYITAAPLWRLILGRASIYDIMRAPYFFAALVMVLGTARWLIFPQTIALMQPRELYFWMGIYLLSIAAASSVAWSLKYSERFR